MIEITDLLDLSKTIAAELFRGKRYPWDVLGEISEFIVELGKKLSADDYENPKENVWIAKNATVFDTAYIKGPCIIDSLAEVRHCAFIRGSAIIGKESVIGNSTEVKNAIIFDEVQAPHYNYVGDSVLGYKSHMGAGSVTSNVKSDKTDVAVKIDNMKIMTGRRKFGAIVGDYVEVGCNSVLNPGTVIGRGTNIYPLSSVRGVVSANSIYKDADNIVLKKY